MPQRQSIDAIVRIVVGSHHIDGLSLAVVRNGRLAYARGYGFADRRRSIAVRPATIFAIGSLEKSFLAATVLRLAQHGRLSLADSLDRYVPWYANARGVTIEELLNHTSGVPDYAQLPGFDRARRDPVSPEALVRRVAALPLLFVPGTRRQYSNTNYVLLGLVVERVTGMPLARWLQRDLLRPLHLTATASWSPFLYEAGRAQGSVAPGSGSLGFGAANLESNVLDLSRWIGDLLSLRVVDATNLARMLGGMGFSSGRIGTHRGAWHSGYVAGYSAFVAIVPQERLGVVLLCNEDAVDLGPLAQSVLDDASSR